MPIGRIRNGRGHRQPGVPFTLGHQLQRARGIARQYRHRRDELAGASRARVRGDGGLVAVKTLAAALAPMARLGFMHGHDAVPTLPWLEAYPRRRPGHILMQQWAQELGVPGIALPLGPGAQFLILHPGQRAQQLPDAVCKQIVRCPSPLRALEWASCPGPLAVLAPAAGPASGPIPGCAERALASAHAAPVAPGNAAASSAQRVAPPPPALPSSSGPPWPCGAPLRHSTGHAPAATGPWPAARRNCPRPTRSRYK